jgi:hypothetical protein
MGYVAITMAFHFFGALIKDINFGPIQIFRPLENSAPFMAVVAISTLYWLAPFRMVEQHFLSWLHSRRQMRGDLRMLTQHLEDCALVPTAEERRRNNETLASFQVYVTDGDSKTINLGSVATWRKTASLLRYVREWETDQSRILSDDELKVLAELERAHSRKTRLATEIIRVLEHLPEGGDTTKAKAVSEILARAAHEDRSGVSALEEKAQARLERTGPPSDGALRLSAVELAEHLKQIEGYFLVEYRVMLEQTAELAAKAILRTGDKAAERLEELKAAGFQGLGTVRPLSAHRIVWFLTSIAASGFLLYYWFWIGEAVDRASKAGVTPDRIPELRRAMLIGIAGFVVGMALASLVGAFFGSSRSNVRAREASWGTYALASSIAVFVFLVLQLILETVKTSLDATLAAQIMYPTGPAQLLKVYAPWSVLPFLAAAGICWMARQRPWLAWIGNPLGQKPAAALERVVDGLVVGLLMIMGFALALGLMDLFDQPPSPILKPGFDREVVQNLFVLGFFIGALVVRDVRAAAHAQLVALEQPKSEDAVGVPALKQAPA